MSGIGFLGGTFDPPHLGHLLLAETALEALNLKRVVFIPVGQPTHKTTMTPANHRLAMTQAATLADERFEVASIDIDRPPPHYTADLIPLLDAKWPAQKLTLLLGGDSIAELPTWHDPQRLIHSISIAGLQRPGYKIMWEEINQVIPQAQQKIKMFTGPAIFISSTAIRNDLAQGRCFRYLIPAGVREYINRHNLYQN
jgi:nicotinate-nucleotide adenylyltransferase